MVKQNIIDIQDDYHVLDEYLNEYKGKNIFLVCGHSYNHLNIKKYFDTLDINFVRFSDFEPNPTYESTVKGVQKFKEADTDLIIAIGGGSAMDVAKCIKLFSSMDPSIPYLQQDFKDNSIKLWAMPTTAGTGSEATRYAVIYYEGNKQSVTHDSIIPSTVIFDSSSLDSLPLNTKKVTMLDALCHSIESYWSVNSTEESKALSKKAIQMILKYKDGYLDNTKEGNQGMLEAAFIAGEAINITQTTAGHAMSYKLTSLYNMPHGQAVAIVSTKLFPWMVKNIDKCIDTRGKEYLKGIFEEISKALNQSSIEEACEYFQELVDSLNLEKVKDVTDEEYEILKTSVNPTRLKNNPVELDIDSIDDLYHEILK